MRLVRSALTVSLFALFAIGGLVISFLVFPWIRRPTTARTIVRCLWSGLVRLFVFLRLISVEVVGERDFRGCIFIANHPSLIDVVLITVLFPRVCSVYKRSLAWNPFVGPIVRKACLANDAAIALRVREVLAEGGNLLIFPEGTRTPLDGKLLPFKRGAAQLALRQGVPVVPIRIDLSRRILAKHQSIVDMGEARVRYRFRVGPKIFPPTGKGEHPEVWRPSRREVDQLTEELARALA